MAEVITMPRLSDTMEEGKVAKWHKKIGDPIKEGDILAEIETDKAVQDFESEFNGTLLYEGVKEGEGAKVDAVLAIIGNKGEDIQALIQSIKKEDANNNTAVDNLQDKNVNIETKSNDIEIPKGVEIIAMPRLSDTMEEGKVAKWNKKVGESIKEGDVLAEIETDKAVQDFESEFNGTLLYQGVKEGEGAKIDAILAIIGPAGTDVSSFILKTNNIPAPNDANPKVENKSISIQSIENKKQETFSANRIFISPLAKQLAKEKGIDISLVTGSGDKGRIVKKDIENFSVNTSSQTKTSPITSPQISAAVINGMDSETLNSQVRNIIAKRLSESKNTAPHYYLSIELDMDNAIKSRECINTIPNTKISFNDLVVKAIAVALRKHKQVNSSWAGDKIIHHGNINIGIAVAIEDGLIVPVLKNTDCMSLTQISSSVKDMATRAKEKKLKADEIEGSTFSVSNLGMFGIESFTSIINQPNAGILSIGSIIEKPVVKNRQIVIGNIMKVTLACDHRVVDGVTGAQFLQTFKLLIENPVTILA